MADPKPPQHPPGPYTPTLILHGGAGSITRSHLPPALYASYAASLTRYVESTHELLQSNHTALSAACHAVTLLEDDPLFNCGRGSVFTCAGEIEMEASVMVCSVDPGWDGEGSVKRGAGVSLIRGTRHPILLARELLREGDRGGREVGGMHCQRSGGEVEEWGWGRGLERKGRDWFWTRKRWEEHRRGLEGRGTGDEVSCEEVFTVGDEDQETDDREMDLPSQGTVGAVCMDSWGTLAVATSTGGLTNKKPGRIGDTPTLGAGFWAESWDEEIPIPRSPHPKLGPLDLAAAEIESGFVAWIAGLLRQTRGTPRKDQTILPISKLAAKKSPSQSPSHPSPTPHRRAIALSGTGNGDSFLRTSAVRTAAAVARFRSSSLAEAVSNIAGCEGELQRSAGGRWGASGEGEGGMIGIEVGSEGRKGELVADFNCGGMWRAWVDEEGIGRVRVFRGEYE